MTNKTDVLDHGFVALENVMGNDLTVVNAARVSFATRSSTMEEKDEGLIDFLLRNHHATPFEHFVLQFHIKCPIFVAREWFRHRNGSFNEMSMRYHKPEVEFYTPAEEDWRKQTGKPGSYTFEPTTPAMAGVSTVVMNNVYEHAKEVYDYLIDAGVAKELARCVLPVGVYTEFFWTVNGRSLMNFLRLRNDRHAQKEIRDYAIAIENMFASHFPIVHRTFVEAGRPNI